VPWQGEPAQEEAESQRAGPVQKQEQRLASVPGQFALGVPLTFTLYLAASRCNRTASRNRSSGVNAGPTTCRRNERALAIVR
jgi:hypothetical protein